MLPFSVASVGTDAHAYGIHPETIQRAAAEARAVKGGSECGDHSEQVDESLFNKVASQDHCHLIVQILARIADDNHLDRLVVLLGHMRRGVDARLGKCASGLVLMMIDLVDEARL